MNISRLSFLREWKETFLWNTFPRLFPPKSDEDWACTRSRNFLFAPLYRNHYFSPSSREKIMLLSWWSERRRRKTRQWAWSATYRERETRHCTLNSPYCGMFHAVARMQKSHEKWEEESYATMALERKEGGKTNLFLEIFPIACRRSLLLNHQKLSERVEKFPWLDRAALREGARLEESE